MSTTTTSPDLVCAPPDERQRYFNRNTLALAVDFVMFSTALSFLNLNTVVPALASRLTDSALVVGGLVTAFQIGWDLPQLVAGNAVARHLCKKPVIVRMAAIGRPPILLFAALLALTGAQPAWLILAALYCVLFAFTGTDAFAGVAWLDLIGRVYPPDRRGRHIAVWQVLTALCGLGAGALVGLILSERGPAYPYNYALIFAAGGIALLFSLAGLLRVRETTPLAHEQTTALPWRDLIPHVIALWRRDPLLRRVALARVAFSLSAMAHPFFVLYATEVLALPPQTIGLFIAVQTVGALLTSVLMGRLADRHGPQLALQIGVLIVLSAPILALILVFVSLPAGHPLAYVYAWIYVCIGVAGNLIMMGFMNYVLEIAPPDRRPFYFGTANFVNSVGMLGPAIAGWLLTWATYPVLFAVSLGFGLITVLLVFRLPHRNQRESFQQIITH